MEDDSFPSILPPFLPDVTDYAINQWGTSIRPRVYDFPVQVHPMSQFTVAVDKKELILKEPAEQPPELDPNDKTFMTSSEASVVRNMNLIDPIIPGQLMTRLFRENTVKQKPRDPFNEKIYDSEENTVMSKSNSLTCETFEFDNKTYLVTFFDKFMEVNILFIYHNFIYLL